MIPMAHHKDIQPHDCQYVDIDPHDKARQLSIYIYIYTENLSYISPKPTSLSFGRATLA